MVEQRYYGNDELAFDHAFQARAELQDSQRRPGNHTRRDVGTGFEFIDTEYHCESFIPRNGYTTELSRQLVSISRVIITDEYCTVYAQDRCNPEIDVRYEGYALLRTEHNHNLLRSFLPATENRPPRMQLPNGIFLRGGPKARFFKQCVCAEYPNGLVALLVDSPYRLR